MYEFSTSRILLLIGVFLGSLAMDFLFAYWTKSVIEGKRTTATVTTGLYCIINMSVIVLFVMDYAMIPASILGHMVGTWFAVKPIENNV